MGGGRDREEGERRGGVGWGWGVGGCKFKQHVARGRVDGKSADTGDGGGGGESRERGG